jgi:hypothetical protein
MVRKKSQLAKIKGKDCRKGWETASQFTAKSKFLGMKNVAESCAKSAQKRRSKSSAIQKEYYANNLGRRRCYETLLISKKFRTVSHCLFSLGCIGKSVKELLTFICPPPPSHLLSLYIILAPSFSFHKEVCGLNWWS